MSAPGVADGNQFSGTLSGATSRAIWISNSLSVGAAGSYVNNGNAVAAGVIGNWNVGNSAYRATGIFAGGLVQVAH